MPKFLSIVTVLMLVAGAQFSWAAEKYCLYWPIYTDGASTLYAADCINTDDANPCANSVFVYYWGATGDTSVPETCPDCIHVTTTARSEPMKGLKNPIPAGIGFTDIVPGSWARTVGDAETWYPRYGTTTGKTQLVSVKTESGAIAVRLFEVNMSPTKAKLPSGKDRSFLLGFETTDEPSGTTYDPRKKPQAKSRYQGIIRVGNVDYTIVTKSPLFPQN